MKATLLKVLAILAVAASAVSVGTAGAGASGSPQVLLPDRPDDRSGPADAPAPSIDDGIGAAEMEDLVDAAEQFGMPIDEVIARYSWNDNFYHVVHEIREAMPESLSAAEIVDANNAWIAFAGDLPSGKAMDGIEVFARAFPDVKVEIRTGTGFTEGQLSELIATEHYAMLETSGVLTLSTRHVSETNQLVHTVTIDSKVTSVNELREQAARSVARSKVEALADVEVVVGETPEEVKAMEQTKHRGGEILFFADGLNFCTQGFGTRNGSHTQGWRGTASAGHCPNSMFDDGANLIWYDEHVGLHGDFQVHQNGPEGEGDDFYSGKNNGPLERRLRDVSAVQDMGKHGLVCKNGARTFKSCHTITDVSTCNAGACNLAQMQPHETDGGDSGGPVYMGNTAYGFMQGWTFDISGFEFRDYYSKATLLDEGVGPHVATN